MNRSPEARPESHLPGRLLLLASASAASFFLLARAVAKRDTASIDRKVQKKVKVPSGEPLRDAAEHIYPIGKWWTYVPAAGVIATSLLLPGDGRDRSTIRRRRAGAAAVGLSAITAALLNEILDDVVPQPPAPPGRPSPRHPVFPSGHTFGTASVGLTAAWVFTREGMVSPSIAFPIAFLIPAISAGARMMEEKHWLSDVAGGVLVALTVSSLSLTLYEWERRDGPRTCHPEREGGGHARDLTMSQPF